MKRKRRSEEHIMATLNEKGRHAPTSEVNRFMNAKPLTAILIMTITLVLLPLILLFVVELSQRRDVWLTLNWPFQTAIIPRLISANAFLYSWSLIASFFI